MRPALLVFIMASMACGDDDFAFSAQITLAQTLQEDTTELAVYLLSDTRTNGKVAQCQWYQDSSNAEEVRNNPDDFTIFHQTNVPLATGDSTRAVFNVPAGFFPVLLIEALDSNKNVIGLGCQDDLSVATGSQQTVRLTIYP